MGSSVSGFGILAGLAAAAWHPLPACQDDNGLADGKHSAHCLGDTEARLKGPALDRVAKTPSRRSAMITSTRACWASRALRMQLTVDGPRSATLDGRMMPSGGAGLGVALYLTCMPVSSAVRRRALSSVCQG